MVAIVEGHLFMADLTGYTAFMTTSELEHAGPVVSALLGKVIDEIDAPLEIANLEGDAVFFRGPGDGFITAQTLLEINERIYGAFADQRRQMIANTTCPCRACANIAGLDLKVFAHYGRFQVLEMAGRKELSGPDVILLHRMAKTAVKEQTGISCYLLMTKAAADETGVAGHARHLTPYSEEFEHFGTVDMLVHDLGAAWQAFQSAQEPIYIAKDAAMWSGETTVAGSRPVIWDALNQPSQKQIWMGMKSVDVANGPGDARLGIGSDYHCVHEEADVRFRVIDYRPFDYFSAVEQDPMGSGLIYRETWEIDDGPDGPVVRFNVDRPTDTEGNVIPLEDERVQTIIGLYQAFGGPMLDGLKGYLAARS